VVPVVVRSLIPLTHGTGTFGGSLRGGNGNGFPAEEDTFAFDVPSGAPAIQVQYTLPSDPNTSVTGYLTSPSGQVLATQIPLQDATGVERMQLYARDPQPGRWVLTFVTTNPVGGTTITGPFNGTVSLRALPVSATGVPDSPSAHIPAGGHATASVKVTNTGSTPLNVFIDPRLTSRTLYSLTAITPATGLPLPLVTLANPPLFLVPTETDLLEAAAQATAPVTFDWGFNDPDLFAVSSGDNASGVFAAPEVTNGIWFIAPNMIGPFTGPGSATVNTGMVGRSDLAAGNSGHGQPGPDGVDTSDVHGEWAPRPDRRRRPAGRRQHCAIRFGERDHRHPVQVQGALDIMGGGRATARRLRLRYQSHVLYVSFQG
jgi:hypothetical protein